MCGWVVIWYDHRYALNITNLNAWLTSNNKNSFEVTMLLLFQNIFYLCVHIRIPKWVDLYVYIATYVASYIALI